MGRHPINQRLDRVHSDGTVDFQSDRLTVSAPLLQMAHPKAYESCIGLLGALR